MENKVPQLRIQVRQISLFIIIIIIIIILVVVMIIIIPFVSVLCQFAKFNFALNQKKIQYKRVIIIIIIIKKIIIIIIIIITN